MNLLFVVQRYGPEVAGGAERCALEYAERLAARGHSVHVTTTCAQSYVDWDNAYAPGSTQINGVTVHRFPVRRPRNNDLFGPLNHRVVWSGRGRPASALLEREWMQLQGPDAPEIVPWVREHGSSYQAAVFFTYLYWTTWASLASARAVTPTVLFPTAHDEAPIYLGLFDRMFRMPDALAYLAEEERAFVLRRFGVDLPSEVLGVGVELDKTATQREITEFRVKHGLGHAPYLVFVGRVDPSKGSVELFDFFATYKRRNPGSLNLVIVGEPVHPLPFHPDVTITGFISEREKLAAIGGASALVQPSYFESFSIVLCEAWVQRCPVLVQGRCDVLAGQCRRSGGGFAYHGFAEFEAAVDLLLEDPALRRTMGENGRHYVEARYEWNTLLDRFESLMSRMVAA